MKLGVFIVTILMKNKAVTDAGEKTDNVQAQIVDIGGATGNIYLDGFVDDGCAETECDGDS